MSALLFFSVALFTTSPQKSPAAEESPYLRGQLLVATEEMKDARFIETVLYVIDHDARGAMALVVNRRLGRRPISELLKAVGGPDEKRDAEIDLHYGGPVDPARGFVLHTDDFRLATTTIIADGMALTREAKILSAIAGGAGPRRSLFAFGYAGWAPGQLEAEIKAGAWFPISADKDLIFGENAETKWREATARRKIRL